ncbi:MAG: ATP-binding protein [Thiolinea sp.]
MIKDTITPHAVAAPDTAAPVPDDGQDKLFTLTPSSSKLSDYARIHAGRVRLVYELFEPHQLLEKVATRIATQARIQRPRLRIHCYTPIDTPEPLRGDQGYLEKMLMNLAENALKFTVSGEIHFSCEMLEMEQANHTVTLRFEVRDTGVGISAAQIEEIFKPFTHYQEPNPGAAAVPDNPNSGLGLSIVRKLADMMGGHLDVESAPGLGSRFWFDVPLSISSPRTRLAPYNDMALDGRYILLVSDNDSAQLILRNYLKAWKTRPILAGSAREALQMLRNSLTLNEPFYTAILDLDQDEVNHELLNAIASNPRYASLPLIMAGTPPQQTASTGKMTAGATDSLSSPLPLLTLSRPLIRTQLLNLLTREVKQQQAGRSSFPAPASNQVEERILLLERNPLDAVIATTILDSIPVKTQLIREENQLIQQMIDAPYSLLLLDLKIVNKSLYDTGLVKILRAWEQHNGQRAIPVIAMAAYIPGTDPLEYLQANGIDDYIPKPVRKDEMLAILKRWLNRSQPGPS